MTIVSKIDTQMKGMLEALALLMHHNLNIMDDGNCNDASPSSEIKNSFSDTDDDSTTHTYCVKVATILVDLSDTEIDDWKENEHQYAEVDVKE